MSKKVLFRWLTVVLAFGLLAAACGDGRDGGTTTDTGAPGTTTAGTTPGGSEPVTTEPTDDPCAGVTLEATETGVTADEITLIVMADVDSPLAPGLFQGSVDGAKAWADDINSRGGLGCRQVNMVFHDSMLNPTETTNGFLEACQSALAMVGTTVLFSNDTTDLQTCPDAAGNATGVARPGLHRLRGRPPVLDGVVLAQPPRRRVPLRDGSPRLQRRPGAAGWALDQAGGDLHGVFLVPGDLPSTTAPAVPNIAGQEAKGVVFDKVYKVSGSATQSAFTPFVQAMKADGSNYVYNGSNDAAMAKMINEATAQNLDTSSVTWLCSLSCYTPTFLENGAAVEGTYVWLFFLPFEEADTNEELGKFMNAIGTDFPAAWLPAPGATVCSSSRWSTRSSPPTDRTPSPGSGCSTSPQGHRVQRQRMVGRRRLHDHQHHLRLLRRPPGGERRVRPSVPRGARHARLRRRHHQGDRRPWPLHA
ncbi:MAG: hypothetical protein R2695_10005 [Acidimicrobiales bacterium]